MSGRDARLSRIDLAVACALAIDFAFEAALAHGVPHSGRLPTLIAAAPFAAAVGARRRWPRTALVTGMAVALIQQALHGQLFTTLPSESAALVPILCSYGVGAWVDLRRGLIALAGAAALLYGVALAAAAQHASGAPGLTGGLGIIAFFLLPPWVIGCLVRERTGRAEAFAALERQTLAEREQRERAAVAEERALIGRELQDIIAHSVSVMVVQAGGARRSLSAQPERARDSILAVEETGRQALAEMRRLLGILRRDDDPRALCAQPGLDQLRDLSAAMCVRGLECRLESAELPALTPGADLLAYRVLEAALAAVADAGGSRAGVAVHCRGGALELEVRAPGVEPHLGARLSGIGPRVELYDGLLEVEPADGPGVLGAVVRCRLPLGAAVVA